MLISGIREKRHAYFVTLVGNLHALFGGALALTMTYNALS